MPDKPVETTWLGTKVIPAARRARRAGRKLGRAARSKVLPRLGALGPVPLNVPTVDLLVSSDGHSVNRCDVVVLGIPEGARIPADWREVLIHAERHSVPTVLLVSAAQDLENPLAAVVTHLATTEKSLVAAVEAFAGAERTGFLDPLGDRREQTAALLELTGTHTPVEKN